MKFLILLSFLGFAAASFMERAAPVMDDAVDAMAEGMSRSGSLRAALDMPDAYELDKVEADLKEIIVEKLKEHLNNLLEKLKDHIDHGKVIGQKLMEEIADVREKLKDLHVTLGDKAKELLNKLWEKLKEKINLKNIWEKLKKIFESSERQTRDLQRILDEVKEFNFKDFVEQLKEKLINNETIKKIREYVKNIVTDNPIIKRFKEVIAKLRDVDIKEFLHNLFHRDTTRSARALKDLWEKIKDHFREWKIVWKERWGKFGEWVKTTWNQGLEKLKDRHAMMKELAKEFIAHIKDVSKEVIREAIEFFEPYKNDLGALWNELIKVAKEQLGH